MKPSVAPVIENTFEERMRVMDVVDTVRDIQHDVNRVLGEEDNEKALVAQLRAIYESQGRDVDDSTIRQGLELYKSGRYEFEAPQEDLGLKLANLYITRDTWGPVLALRSVLSVALVALISGGVWGVGEVRYQSWKSDAKESIEEEAFVRQNQTALMDRLTKLPTNPKALMEMGQSARKELTESGRILAMVPTLPAGAEELERMYDRDADAARQVVKARDNQLLAASTHVGSAKKTLTNAQGLLAAYQGINAFDVETPAYLENFRQQQRFSFQRAAEESNPQGMEAAVNLFQRGLVVHQQLDMFAAQASALAGGHLSQVTSQLEETRTLLGSGNVAAAETMLSDLSTKLEMLAMTYSLRIVSEEGERTGVQRSFQDSASSYYIIVDAIDSAGNPVKLPITNVETKRKEMVSRFGIRVPQEVYNAIGKDKQDDGIVDKNIFGRKAAGELEPQLDFQALEGYITHW
jgi:hypothetical protein